MLKKLTTFLNDQDGLSVTDYLCVLVSITFTILVTATFVLTAMAETTEQITRCQMLRELLTVIEDPFKTILSAYFAFNMLGRTKDIFLQKETERG